MTDTEALNIAMRAARMALDMRPRPTQVTQTQAAEMLGVSRPTVSRMIAAGVIRLNKAGMISITEIDKVLGDL